MAASGGKVRRGGDFDELGLVATVRETDLMLDDEEYLKSCEEMIENVELAPVYIFHRQEEPLQILHEEVQHRM